MFGNCKTRGHGDDPQQSDYIPVLAQNISDLVSGIWQFLISWNFDGFLFHFEIGGAWSCPLLTRHGRVASSVRSRISNLSNPIRAFTFCVEFLQIYMIKSVRSYWEMPRSSKPVQVKYTIVPLILCNWYLTTHLYLISNIRNNNSSHCPYSSCCNEVCANYLFVLGARGNQGLYLIWLSKLHCMPQLWEIIIRSQCTV